MMRCGSASASGTGRHRSKTAASPPTNTCSVPARGVKNADAAGLRSSGEFPPGCRAAAGHVNPHRGRHDSQHAAGSCHHLALLTKTGQHRDEDIGACGYLPERGALLDPALHDPSLKLITRITRSHHVPGDHEVRADGQSHLPYADGTRYTPCQVRSRRRHGGQRKAGAAHRLGDRGCRRLPPVDICRTPVRLSWGRCLTVPGACRVAAAFAGRPG